MGSFAKLLPRACTKYDCLRDEARIAHWSFADPESFESESPTLTTFFS